MPDNMSSNQCPELVQVGCYFKLHDVVERVLEIDPERESYGRTGYVKVINTSGRILWVSLNVFEGLSPIPPSEISYDIRLMMDRIVELTAVNKDLGHRFDDLFSQINDLKDRIRELEHGKFKIVEVDQWTSTGNVEGLTLENFAVERVTGGDADVARQVGIASGRIREVYGNQRPSKGSVWLRPNEDGKLEQWKANYDTSD